MRIIRNLTIGACLLLFVLSTVEVKAQINNSDFKVELAPEDLGVCGDNSYEYVTVIAKKNTLSSFEIVMDLPDGVRFLPGTQSLTAAPSGYGFSTVSIADVNRPRFAITKAGNWNIGDAVTFRFMRTAGCEAVQFKNNSGGIFKDAQEIYYTDGGVADSATDYALTIYTYNLLDPSISIQSIPTLTVNVGDTPSRSVELEQGGQGCIEEFQYFVLVEPDIHNYVLSYMGTNLVPDAVVPGVGRDTLFYEFDITQAPFTSAIGDGDDCWENGELIVFEEDFLIAGCDDVEVRHNARWGCLSDVCQSAAPQSGGISFSSGVPSITLTELNAQTIDLCDVITYTVRIDNAAGAGVSPAFDLNVIYGEGHNSSPISTPLSQELWGQTRYGTRNWNNFSLNGNSITETTIDNGAWADSWGHPSWIPYNYFTSDPDGIGVGLDDIDGDGFYDDLAPGESVTVTFDFWTTPRSNCGTGRYDYLGWEHNYFDVSFFDQCGEIRPDPKRIDFDYKNFIRDYQNSTSSVVPTDIDDGVDFNLSLKPHLYTNSVQCHGENALTGSFSHWDVRLFLPTGVSLSTSDGIDAGLTAYGASKTVIPGVGGDTVVYALNRYVYTDYNFLLNLDCAAFQAAGGGGTLTIPYETTYYCTDGTNDCWVQKIHCGSFTMTTHCLGACKGPSTTAFEALRTTAGFTDESMSALETLDPSLHNLNTYNPADTMLVTATAVIVDSTITSLYFDLDYTAPSNHDGASVIQFVSGTIGIHDVSSGQYTGTIAGPLSTISSGNDHTQTFDLSSYAALVSPSYEYGEGNQRDTVFLALKYVWTKNFPTNVVHELEGFTGRHYAVHPVTSQEVGCDEYGTRAFYHKMRFNTSSWTANASACTPEYNTAFITRSSATSDLHPGEYRPPMFWDSTLVVLPVGVAFSGKVDLYDLSWYYDISTYNVIGDSIWIYPPPTFINPDQRSTYYPRVRVETYGNCESQPTQSWSTKHFFTEYAYHPDPSVHESVEREVNNTPFNYVRPGFLLQSPTPNENGFATSVSWDVELCNTSTTDIQYNWFKVEQDPNLVLDSVVNSTTGTALNIVSQDGADYVEAGSLSLSPACNYYTVYASYSTCDIDTLTFQHGWDCLAYPTDYTANSASCFQEELELVVEPQEAQIQLSVTGEPTVPVTLCSQFTVQVEFISAQISDANDPYLQFTLPGGASGIIIDSVRVEYPAMSGNFQNVAWTSTGVLGTVDLMDHPVVASQEGLLGTENATTTEERIALVFFHFQLGCDFPSGTSMDFAPFATSPCGDIAVGSGGVTTSDAFFVDGAIAPYDAYTSIVPPDMDYCGSSTINFQTTIVGGTTAMADTMEISLPIGLSYDPGSINCLGANCPVGSVTINNDLAYERIYVPLPSAVPDGGLIEFELDVVHEAPVCANPASISVFTYFSNAGLSCASSTCSATPIPTGASTETFIIAKPELEVNSASFDVALSPDGQYYYSGEVEVINTGLDATQVYDYELYCSDGSGNPSGIALQTGTMISQLDNGQTETVFFSFFENAICSPGQLIFQVAPSAADCLCDTLTEELSVSVLPPLPDRDGDDVADDFDLDDDNDGILDIIECQLWTEWDNSTSGSASVEGQLSGVGVTVTHTGANSNPSILNSISNFYGNHGVHEIASSWFEGAGVEYLRFVESGLAVYTITFDTALPFDMYVHVTAGDQNMDFSVGDLQTVINGTGLGTNSIVFQNVLGIVNECGYSVLVPQGTSSFTMSPPNTTADSYYVAFSRADCVDTDGDGVEDKFDLDSDNDGIFDLVEAGHGEADLDTNGVIDGGAIDFGDNGFFDDLETSSESGTPTFTAMDSDGDGHFDFTELDSDNDGCYDVIEAGFTDGNNNGIFGDGN